MRIYTVWEPPAAATDPAARARTRFVREGFSWLALFFPVLWQMFHGMWLVLIGFLALVLAAEAALAFVPAVPGGLAGLVLSLLFAFEARTLYGWTLARRRWRVAGVVAAESREAAERRWFDGLFAAPAASDGPAPPATPAEDAARPGPWEDAGPSVPPVAPAGLFPETRPAR